MFIDCGTKGIWGAPAERNVFLASRTRKDISLRWSWDLSLGQRSINITSLRDWGAID